jgi:hypothetical protein
MKRLTLAARIRAMKIGDTFSVETGGERAKILAVAKTLRDAGVIDFLMHTKPSEKGGFSATAVPE